MVLLGLGSLAAAATVGLIWGDRLRDRIAAQRAAAGRTTQRTGRRTRAMHGPAPGIRRASSAERPARVILVRALSAATMACRPERGEPT